MKAAGLGSREIRHRGSRGVVKHGSTNARRCRGAEQPRKSTGAFEGREATRHGGTKTRRQGGGLRRNTGDRNQGDKIKSQWSLLAHLVHRVGEEGFKGPPLEKALLLEPLQNGGKLVPLLALSQNLETVVMVSDVLLVDGQHRKEHVEQIS